MKYSIVIPAYNVAGYVEKCLDSILQQTFREFEVIVVDDGSTDKTPEILDEYAERDSRIKVIHKINEGVSVARNTGIDIAKGEYFLFFDGDDFIEPYTIEELNQKLEEESVDTILYGYYRFMEEQILETCPPIFQSRRYEGEEILTTLLPRFIGISSENINKWLKKEEKALYVENPALWRAVVNADIVRKQNLRFNKNLKVGEDTIFITEYLSYSKKCYVCDKCYYYLVTRETSTIYVYERNPEAKLQGKINLLTAREELTEKLQKRMGIDISEKWSGTVLMSCMEIAFLMSMKNPNIGFFKRYKLFREYVDLGKVRDIIKKFKIESRVNVFIIPFLLLKFRLNFLLYLCCKILQVVGFRFQR